MAWWLLVLALALPFLMVGIALGFEAKGSWLIRNQVAIFLSVAVVQGALAVARLVTNPRSWLQAAASGIVSVLSLLIALNARRTKLRGGKSPAA